MNLAAGVGRKDRFGSAQTGAGRNSVRGGLTYRNACRRLSAMMRKLAGAEMSPSYFVEPIGPETIDRAYPLAQAVIPALSKQEWWQFCRSLDFAEGHHSTVGE